MVTVEAVDVSRDGLQRRHDGSDGESGDPSAQHDRTTKPERVVNVKKDQRSGGNGSLNQQPKKRKKKFRYESKAERKATRFKERSGSKAKAKTRRG